jgi:hypothetical protein
MYYEHLLFKRSYTNSSVIFSGGRAGLRVDRVLVCEVLKNAEHLNKCLRISYAYKLEEHRKLKRKKEFGADFKMDIVREGTQRLIWMHKDETESQFQKS